jgi:hypothetical protein
MLVGMRVEVGGWLWTAWACLFALAVAVLAMVRESIVVCDATFSWVEPEPPGWRDWPLADADATEIIDRGGCWGTPLSSYEAAPLFEGQPSGIPRRTWMRRDPSGRVYVGAGPATNDEAPKERYLGAFQVAPGKHVGFTSRWAFGFLLELSIAFAMLASALVVAHRRIRRAWARAESVRKAYAEVASDPPTYRRSPSAGDPVSAEECVAQGAESAKRVLLKALGSLAALLLLTVVAGTLFLVREFYRLVL